MKPEISIPTFILSVVCHLTRKHVVTVWVWNWCKWKGQNYSHGTHIQRAEVNFSILSWNYKCFCSVFLTTFCGTIVRKTSGHVSLTKRVIDNQNQQLRAKRAAVWLFVKIFENMIIHFYEYCSFISRVKNYMVTQGGTASASISLAKMLYSKKVSISYGMF